MEHNRTLFNSTEVIHIFDYVELAERAIISSFK